jgi:single-stranded-DNA-specific exonuclease
MLRQLLFRRGVHSALEAQQYLHAEGSLFDPFILKDMPIAVDRIMRALQQGEKIVVYGDYDADGITATALLVQWLRFLKGNVQEYIPDRFTEGYGLNLEAMQTLHDLGVQLIITVDCGIRSIKEVERANELGVDVIVSDHHWPEAELPPARAIICPKQEGDEYPEKNLAGVGIAYKIAEALAARLDIPQAEVDEYLDLVALGTVADLADLTGENRALVRKGLSLLRSGSRLGVRALAGAANVDISKINARTIGFTLAPRLNAVGRLKNDQLDTDQSDTEQLEIAQSAYQLLITQNGQEAGLLAQRLDDKNKTRQRITNDIQQAVRDRLQNEELGYLVYARDESFNPGIVGLAASRLVEHYYRPAIVGALDAVSDTTRASCRSINEFNITEALDACSELLEHHGGHKMAAGFTVKNENWDELISRLQTIAANQLKDIELHQSIEADWELDGIESVTALLKGDEGGNIYDWSDQLEPTGMANPEVILIVRNLVVKECRVIGKEGNRKHLKMKLTGQDKASAVLDGIAWGKGDAWQPGDLTCKKIDLIGKVEKNFYNNQETNQLIIFDFKISEE